jgi:hypothetical protein
MNDVPHIFPTKSRGQHSRLQRYPIGAEALSRALDGAPQHSEIGCIFVATDPHRYKDRNEFFVLSAIYTKRARTHHDGADAEERGVLDPRWEIWVYAVAANFSAKVKAALLDRGLPEMVGPWLRANAHIEGSTGGASIALTFDIKKDRLVSETKESLLPDRS